MMGETGPGDVYVDVDGWFGSLWVDKGERGVTWPADGVNDRAEKGKGEDCPPLSGCGET